MTHEPPCLHHPERKSMTGRTKFDAVQDKRAALRTAEESGKIADSMEVRESLIIRMQAGELTLEQVQDELKKIKRNAKKNGMITRSQAWSRG
jgi:hypothetical protein